MVQDDSIETLKRKARSLEVINSFAGHTKLARAASDHLPIIADFNLSI